MASGPRNQLHWLSQSVGVVITACRLPGTLSLQTRLRDEFAVQIALDRLEPAFRAVARVLDTAERHFRRIPTVTTTLSA